MDFKGAAPLKKLLPSEGRFPLKVISCQPPRKQFFVSSSTWKLHTMIKSILLPHHVSPYCVTYWQNFMKLKTYLRLSVTWVFFGMVNTSILDAPTGSSLGISPNLRGEYVREPAQNGFNVCLYRKHDIQYKISLRLQEKGKKSFEKGN